MENSQIVEHAQRSAREVPELWMIALGLEFRDDHHGHNHFVLVES
jgi:hypothetical protein